ncbi:MAG TPA: PolC-type DNA polymerase III, partial [Candidatus Eisenbergiella merdipullorum]|nr:PolC-type DNA polymerase III [Candidatus Eisenbergiella merdipullorum]
MAKAFFDVFPSLKLEGKRKDLFAQTQVERVTATRAKDFVRVYFGSDRLILKEDVYAVEKEIKRQLFGGMNITVRLYERFHLSSQYSRKALLEVYRESILLELSQYSHLLYSMFKNAEISFPEEDRMHLLIEDTVLARSKSDELGRILEKIFGERCGLPVIVFFEYKEAKSGRFREEDEMLLSRRVEEIASRYRGDGGRRLSSGEAAAQNAGGSSNVHPFPGNKKGAGPAVEAGQAGRAGSEGVSAGPSGVPVSPQADTAYEAYLAGKAQDAAKGGFSRRKGGSDDDFHRSPKRSDNPDVIYGRDFEDEAIPMEEIVGEMGEVTVRGRILKLDKREIKNERTILIFDVTDYTDTFTIKMFAKNDQVAELCEGIKPGAFVKLKGITMIDRFDGELTIGSLVGLKKISDFTHSRQDHSLRKRVELHCHTKMS